MDFWRERKHFSEKRRNSIFSKNFKRENLLFWFFNLKNCWDLWKTLDFLGKILDFCKIVGFLQKKFDLCKNFGYLQKFGFLQKIWIFWKNLDFHIFYLMSTIWFLLITMTKKFGHNFEIWSKCWKWAKIWKSVLKSA